MKTSPCGAVAARLVTVCTLLTSPVVLAVPGNGNQVEPLIPVGSLDAYPVLVQTGTHPTLTWDIQYPETVTDIVYITPPSGPVVPKVDLCMEVRVLGASYQLGWDRKGRPVWGYVQAEVKVGSGSFTRFFYDTQDKVKPNWTYFSQTVQANGPINFRARCYNGSQWLPWRTTEYANANVVALTNGDTPPSTVPAFQQGNIESFLASYLDAGGKIRIGPKDVIFLIELGQTNPQASGFDLQDLVLLATFDYCKNNNGHGNNLDGVDVSNPGQGGGGPNGEEDPSGTIDDERR